MESPIITLTTDWGTRDFFVGKFKGKLLSLVPDARIVDITHEIDPFDIKSACFVVQNACLDFPEGTIHIIDVNSAESTENPSVVVRCKGQYFICVDNGLPNVVFGNLPWEAVMIDKVMWDSNFYTFAALDYFCKVAAMLAKGSAMDEIGYEMNEFFQVSFYNTVKSPDSAKVYVSYVDSYGNADLNITYDEFEEMRCGRNFSLRVHESVIESVSHDYRAKNKSRSYRSDLLLTVSSTGHLQLALPSDSAEQMFGLRVDEDLLIKFY